MPKYNCILNLPGFTIKKVSGFEPILFEVDYHKKHRCPHCNSLHVRKKDSWIREGKHEMYGHRMSLLRLKAFKLYCNDCKRYGNQRFSGIGKHQRATHRLQTQIFYQHTKGISQKDLAPSFRVGKATIERWYHLHYQLQEKEMLNAASPLSWVLMRTFSLANKALQQLFVISKSTKYLILLKAEAKENWQII